MEFGICLQSVVPLRAVPSHRAEMASQILFGELFRILQEDQEWIRIQLSYDNYEGWLNIKQATLLDEAEFLRLLNAETPSSLDLVQLLSNDTRKTIQPVVLGSSLPGMSDQHFRIKDQMFSFDGLITENKFSGPVLSHQSRMALKNRLIDDAMLYLNAPYLWGGRSPFGIDCSGFVQMVYKLSRIKLLRDASQQAKLGEPLNFVSEAEPGDLAFFDDEEGNIIHVGLLTGNGKIIHSTGKVRIDPVDHQGIYNASEKKYTHKLRVMKRII
jgi:gamma-D-glutamyl-L-lysine dipeptidyl-peptidase